MTAFSTIYNPWFNSFPSALDFTYHSNVRAYFTFGTDANEHFIVTTTNAVYINAGGGHDYIQGFSGDDTLYGGDGQDLIIGNNGWDNIYGGDDHDRLYGGIGRDNIFGEAGHDLIYGGADEDFIMGGSGHDTIYGDEERDHIYGGVGHDTIYGGAGSDEIEGGGDNDTLYGNENNDFVAGGSGNDVIFGNEGNDELQGDAGIDRIYGGTGDDTFYLRAAEPSASGVDIITDFTRDATTGGMDNFRISLNADVVAQPTSTIRARDLVADITFATAHTTAPNFTSSTDDATILNTIITRTSGGNDALLLVLEDVSVTLATELFVFEISGDGQDNTIYGSANADIVRGDGSASRGGDDTIYGGAGWDNLAGGYGNDRIYGEGGSDIIGGEGGENYLDGGAGVDEINGGDWRDVIFGGADSDSIDGGDGDNYINGEDGYDSIRAGTGRDYIEGGNGNDSIQSSSGDDTLFGGLGDDRIYAGAGADWIDGGAGTDRISGSNGADTITGGAGNDRIFGGFDNDILRGGLGIDVIDGDQGSDIYYVENTAPAEENTDILADFRRRSNTGEYDRLRIVLEANTPQAWTLDEVLTQANLRVTQEHKTTDHVSTKTDSRSVKNTIFYHTNGTASTDDDVMVLIVEDFTDTLTLDAIQIAITGNAQDNSMTGRSTDDVMHGGDGEDTISGGGGADIIYGEHGGDDIRGDAGADKIYGGSGSDAIRGGAGDDNLYGGTGHDEIHGGGDGDYIYGGAGIDTIKGEDGADTLIGGGGADTIEGGAGADIIEGGGGADMLKGGAGFDRISGGASDDIFDLDITATTDADADLIVDFVHSAFYGEYDRLQVTLAADATTPTTIDALKTTANLRVVKSDTNPIDARSRTDSREQNTLIYATNATETDTSDDILLAVLEDFTDALTLDMFVLATNGTSGRDTIRQTTIAPDLIYGGAGNDTISGGAGDDILYGESGVDSIRGEAGDDKIYGGVDFDILYGGDGKDIIYGGASGDVVDGQNGDDILFGGAGNDRILGGSGDDYIDSGGGDDDIEAGVGNDTIIGGAGHDDIEGDAGINTLEGNSGNDVFDIFNIRGSGSNANIVRDFTYDAGSGEQDYIGLTAAINGTNAVRLTTIAELEFVLGLRIATAQKNIGRIDSKTDDEAINNTLIYDTKFSSTPDDDSIIMVLEDFTEDLTLDMFRLLINGDGNDNNITTGSGDDKIYGSRGHNILRGGAGDDEIFGGTGADTIYGDAGNDKIRGNEDVDTISGGADIDTLTGAHGDDVFVLDLAAQATDTDIITDFTRNGSTNNDRIRIDTARGSENTLSALLTAAGIRTAKEHKNAEGISSTTDSSHIQNTIIYKIVGADDSQGTETNDIMLMVLEDFASNLTIDMFQII